MDGLSRHDADPGPPSIETPGSINVGSYYY